MHFSTYTFWIFAFTFLSLSFLELSKHFFIISMLSYNFFLIFKLSGIDLI